MMDNQTLHDRFRHQLTNTHAVTVLTVSLIEIIGYIILIRSGIEKFSFKNLYLWYGVVVPIIINIISHIAARFIVNHTKLRRKTKNLAIIGAALVTSFIVAVVHREYIVTSCAFVFPMVLSAMFNDKKLLNISYISSLVIIAFVGIAFWRDSNINLSTALNLFVLFGFSFVSYLCGIISINFSNQNYTLIETQAETYDKLLDNVLRDSMTGLYNHKTFTEKLEELVKPSSEGKKFCLVMFDIDDFKEVNDSFGHDCGDEVLIFIAKTLKKHCEEHNSAYRYGGEEFAMIFENNSVSEVYSVVQGVLDEFSGHKFDFADKVFTFSAGIAEYSDGKTSEEIFEAADKTLYKAKKQGKNRILISA